MKITVVGTGYVGLSMTALLAQHHKAIALDIYAALGGAAQRSPPTVNDAFVAQFLAERNLNLRAPTDKADAYAVSRLVPGAWCLVIVATPTDYGSESNAFDTSSVDAVRAHAGLGAAGPGGVKSTVPVGYTASMRERLASGNRVLSPEFLREGLALRDTSCAPAGSCWVSALSGRRPLPRFTA